MRHLRIFVSSCPEDRAFWQRLVAALRREGADVWHDDAGTSSMDAGHLAPTLERELRTRPAFIAVLSPRALASPSAEERAHLAVSLASQDDKRIVQLVLAAPVA